MKLNLVLLYHSVQYNSKNEKPPSHFPHFSLSYAFCPLNLSSVSKQAKATWKRQPCVNIYDVTSPCEQTFLPIHPSLRAYRESPPPGGGSGPQEAQTGAACPPLIQSICFSFDWGQPSCEGISCVSPSVFIQELTSKPILVHCFCDVAAGPEKCPNRKM